MALDIIGMESVEMTCPHCGKKVLMRWQWADYGYGDGNPQFIGLEKAISVESLREKTYPAPPEGRGNEKRTTSDLQIVNRSS